MPGNPTKENEETRPGKAVTAAGQGQASTGYDLQIQTEEIESTLLAAVITKLRVERLIESGNEQDQGLFGIGILGTPGGVSPEVARYTGELLVEEISRYNHRAARTNGVILAQPKISKRRIFDRLFRMGKLQSLLDDPAVEEIEVNTPQKVFVILADKGKKLTDLRFRGDEEVLALVKRMAASAGRHIDEASPLLDLQLPGGERLNVIIPPIARHVTVTIRKHNETINSLEELVDRGTLTRAAATFLSACVAAHLNTLVCGGTGTGKTSMLNCLGSKIGRQERVVVIEEIAELQIERVVTDTVALQTRPANIEGQGEIGLWALIKNSLRMRPTWIVVGEVRGTEALQMLLAITSGHAGLCTLHADDPYSALDRLATLAGMSRESPDEQRLTALIGKAIKIVVHLRHDLTSGRRLVSSILEVTGREEGKVLGNEIFTLKERSDGLTRLVWTGTMPRCLSQLEAVGLNWEQQIAAQEASNKVVPAEDSFLQGNRIAGGTH
jgi:pilus assembly protein CpaF